MITTIIFSRDRACQLDLLLRSIERFAPGVVVRVLYRATTDEYARGYEVVRQEHPDISWRQEIDFQTDVSAMVRRTITDYVMCMTDDSIFRRELSGNTFASVLGRAQEVICFSLRLGQNTTFCYPLDRSQDSPYFFSHFDVKLWEWRQADGDFGYPGSLDAHIFRRDTFENLLRFRSFRNPNEMEDALVAGCRGSDQTLMGSYKESLVVSLPLNRVNETHRNRVGFDETLNEKNLNDLYLAGDRISLDALVDLPVNAAHAELPLEFM